MELLLTCVDLSMYQQDSLRPFYIRKSLNYFASMFKDNIPHLLCKPGTWQAVKMSHGSNFLQLVFRFAPDTFPTYGLVKYIEFEELYMFSV